MSILSDVFNSVADAAGSVLGTVGDIVRPITDILGPVKLVADIATGNIVGAVTDIASVATNFASLTTDQALTAAADLADADFAAAPEVARAASDLAQQVSSGIVSDDDSIIDSIRAGITDTDVFPAMTVASTVADAIKPVQQAVASVSQVVKDVTTPVTAVLNPITDVVKQINDGIIRPILDPLSTAINTFTRLADVIQRDLRDGIAGIVRIPGQLAEAITSVDASFNRAIAQLGVVNAQIARQVLGPELTGASSSPLAAHAGILATAVLTQSLGVGRVSLTPMMSGELPENVRRFLETLTDVAEGRAAAERSSESTEVQSSIMKILEEAGNFPAPLSAALGSIVRNLFGRVPTIAEAGAMLVNIIQASEFLTTIVEDKAELFKQDARQRNPIMLLSSGDVVAAARRGIIDSEAAVREITRQGVSAERFAVLFDLTEQLLAVNDLTSARRRGIIDREFFDAEMSRLGVSADRANILLTLLDAVPSTQDILTMRARGIIDDNDMRVLLERNNVTPEIATLLQQVSVEPESIASAVSAESARASISAGFIANSLSETPPERVLTAARRNLQSEDEARSAWQRRLNLPSAQTFVDSFFLGLRTRTELTAALNLLNVPQEVHDDIIETQRPQLRFTSVLQLVKAGVVTEGAAAELLAQAGFNDESINLMLQLSRIEGRSSKAETAKEAQGISIATANELFQDDALTLDQLIDVNKAHGFSDEAAALTAEVQAMRKQAQERRDLSAFVVDQINAGVIDDISAQQTLFAAGFTDTEVARALRNASRAKVKASKRVSLDELIGMAKKGIITEDDVAAELSAQGFVPPWIERLIQLRLGS